jgi:hypothetical protein
MIGFAFDFSLTGTSFPKTLAGRSNHPQILKHLASPLIAIDNPSMKTKKGKKRGGEKEKTATTPNFRTNPNTPVPRFRNIFNPSEINILTTIPAPENHQKLDKHL